METVGYLFKLFRIFLPFIRELLFGSREDGEEVVRRNKMVVFLMVCLGVLFLFYYHNAYKFDEVIAANNTLSEQAAVLQSKLDAAGQTIQVLSVDLSLERARVTCPANAPLGVVHSGDKK